MSFVNTSDHLQLFYQDWGTGKPLVFLHPWAMSSEMWEYHMLYFNEQGMRCVSFDRRGHGRSERSGDGYYYDRHADDLETVLSYLDLHEVTLVGHSMGCGEIIRYLTRHGSSRISRIVLIAPCAPFLLKTADNPEGVDKMVFDMMRAEMRKDFPKWLTDNAHGFYLPDTFAVSPGFIQWTINMMLNNSFKAVFEGTYQWSETDFRKELSNINVPALIIHGSADASIPVNFGRKVAQLVPHSEYNEYDGAPHGIFFTHIDRLNADILRFVDSK